MAKKKIRIVNKARLLTAAALLTLFIVMTVFLCFSLSGDKIEKQIEKLEDAKITVLDRRFESSVKETDTINMGESVTFRLTYYYRNDETDKISPYHITEDITITIKGDTQETPSAVAKVEGNSIVILPTAKAGDTVEVTLSHEYAEDKVFTFSVGETEVIE